MTTQPPAVKPHTATGGSTSTESASTELRVRAAHLVLAHCQVELSPSKIRRLVHQFEVSVQRNGWTFHEYLFNAANLTADQRRHVLAHQSLARLLSYADPTGEQATNHVLHQRGH